VAVERLPAHYRLTDHQQTDYAQLSAAASATPPYGHENAGQLQNLARIRLAWADADYSGKLTSWAMANLKITVEIIRKHDPHAFEILPRRRVVERTLAWLISHRRCARDYERQPASHEAMVLWGQDRPHDPAPRPHSRST